MHVLVVEAVALLVASRRLWVVAIGVVALIEGSTLIGVGVRAVVLVASFIFLVAERVVLRAPLIFAVAARAVVVTILILMVAHRVVAAMPPILFIVVTSSLARTCVVAVFAADVETLDATSLARERSLVFLSFISVALRLVLLVPAGR